MSVTVIATAWAPSTLPSFDTVVYHCHLVNAARSPLPYHREPNMLLLLIFFFFFNPCGVLRLWARNVKHILAVGEFWILAEYPLRCHIPFGKTEPPWSLGPQGDVMPCSCCSKLWVCLAPCGHGPSGHRKTGTMRRLSSFHLSSYQFSSGTLLTVFMKKHFFSVGLMYE